MNKKQYNNVIDWTITHDQSAQTEDSLKTARTVFKNMGVALPQGDLKQVSDVLKTDDYMGWRSCTMQEAQAAADRGTAAIGINEEKIVILAANDEEQPVTATASVMTLSDTAAENAEPALAFYSYNYGTTVTPVPHGNYLTFSCTQPAVCNDGIGNSHGDVYHQSQTSYMNGTLNADDHRYIVIPKSVSNFSSILGCVGVAVRSDGTYMFGVVGDVGPNRNSGILDEFSVKMIQDLGFNTDGANYVNPSDTVTTYIFTDTRRSSWESETLNAQAEFVGNRYFY